MKWLARLKSGQLLKQDATKPTKPVAGSLDKSFVGFVAPPFDTLPAMPLAAANDSASATMPAAVDIGTIRPPGLTPKLLAASLALDAQIAASDQFRNSHKTLCIDPDRWCYPNSTAMNSQEIDLFAARLARFTDKGLTYGDAESMTDKLVQRDRDSDDRRLCLECTHLGGYGRTSWRCADWQAAGVAMRQRDALLPVALVQQLQRCAGFTSSVTKPVGRRDQPP